MKRIVFFLSVYAVLNLIAWSQVGLNGVTGQIDEAASPAHKAMAGKSKQNEKDAISARAAPNVLMICIDDLNDWTGFLGGHPEARTPHMMRLRNGVAILPMPIVLFLFVLVRESA